MRMRRIAIAAVLLLGIYFVLANIAEVQQVVETLRRGDWRWLAMAAGVQLAWLLNVAVSFRALYRLLGLEERIERLTRIAAAAYFLNVIAPSMGMGGLTLFVVDGKRRGLPTGRITTAVALYYLYDYFGFLVVLILGLLILFRRNQLGPAEIVASGIFVATGIALSTIVALALRSAQNLGQVLATVGSTLNRLLRPLIRRDYLDLSRAHDFANDIGEGLRYLRRSPEGLLLPFGLALSNKALLISILFLVFLAFQQPFSVGTLIAGFSIGYLFLIVSPTPAGIGFVEGAMTLGLNSLRIPLAAAAVITLAYRGITFWLPLGYGMLSFHLVGQPARPPAHRSP